MHNAIITQLGSLDFDIVKKIPECTSTQSWIQKKQHDVEKVVHTGRSVLVSDIPLCQDVPSHGWIELQTPYPSITAGRVGRASSAGGGTEQPL